MCFRQKDFSHRAFLHHRMKTYFPIMFLNHTLGCREYEYSEKIEVLGSHQPQISEVFGAVSGTRFSKSCLLILSLLNYTVFLP